MFLMLKLANWISPAAALIMGQVLQAALCTADLTRPEATSVNNSKSLLTVERQAAAGKTVEMGRTDFDVLRSEFKEPPVRYRPRPLWFWNDTLVTREGVEEQMEKAFHLCGYGGFGILPFGKRFAPSYLSDSYFEVYGAALKKAKQLGMVLSLYDEYGFPSGAAGAPNSSDFSVFAQKYPELTLKRLDKIEVDVTGPKKYETEMPAGYLCAVVAMNMTSLERIDLTETVRGGRLIWQVPAGRWKLMIFLSVPDGEPFCDYLDPDAADRFIEVTHQTYYNWFAEHFGTTIDSTFHDEPTLYRAKGRSWTNRFNEKFQARYGFDPRPYYPALWYDIGPDTQAARNYLFGFRSELYATGFMKRIQDWSAVHRITSTGHQDQEEITNPVSVSGDLMKCFKYQQVPGIDKIGGDRPAERFYKVISSAAYNWDKSLVMSETYGAMDDLSWDQIYLIAMEQYTKGINMLIPHAVWYDDSNVVFKPELSWRNPLYADHLREFNQYLSRLNVMLQNDGAHLADIAVLYPIATCQAGHTLDGALGYYRGGVEIPEADYVAAGEQLIELGYDYTFLHPEVLHEKCRIEKDSIVLPNRISPGRFRVFVLPGHCAIHWSSMQKIQTFYEQGGVVIATGCLPSKSAEFGHDHDVQKAITAIFGSMEPLSDGIMVQTNTAGGRAIRLGRLNAANLRKALEDPEFVYDVSFSSGKPLRYIHKIRDGRHLYFFANLDKEAVETAVTLRGAMDMMFWDPHNGRIWQAQVAHSLKSSFKTTKVDLSLAGTRSVFLCGTEH